MALNSQIPDEEEIKSLLDIDDKEALERLCRTAGKIKESIYGKRIVLFAPLYLSNECSNNCVYCAFRRDNKEIKRKTLTVDEIVQQARLLEKTGFDRVLLVAPEHPEKCSIDYLITVITSIYENTNIHTVNLNSAPFSREEFEKLKNSGIRLFQLFQETYHRKTYEKMHPSTTKKGNFDWRKYTMDRAISAGIKEVGIGALLGLYDYKFEVVELIRHSRELEEKFGFGPRIVSVPRLRPANGALLQKPPYPVSDFDFKKIVAVLRVAIPYAGIAVTTREQPSMRDEIISIGASHISAGSRTEPGGYLEEKPCREEDGQFFIADKRSREEIIEMLRKGNYEYQNNFEW